MSLLWVLCVVRQTSLRRADNSCRVVTPNVVEEPHMRGLGPLGLSNNEKSAILVIKCGT
jgi:hypothetical protein